MTFWRGELAQATRDAALARERAPSVLPALVERRRAAWRELKAALTNAEAAKGGAPSTAGEVAPTPDTSLEAQLAKVQQMRAAAESKGSYVAAARLLLQEGQVCDAIRARNDAAEKAARAGRSAEERIEALVARIHAMPPSMQERIRRALGW